MTLLDLSKQPGQILRFQNGQLSHWEDGFSTLVDLELPVVLGNPIDNSNLWRVYYQEGMQLSGLVYSFNRLY